MNAWSTNPLTDPRGLILLFPLLWLALTGLTSHLGGWANLAAKFATQAETSGGERFRFVSGAMGKPYFPVNYGNCLFVTVGPEGFALSILFPFRFLSPPLFVPWEHVEEVSERRRFFMRHVVVVVKGHWPQISLWGKAGEAVQRAFLAYRSGSVAQTRSSGGRR